MRYSKERQARHSGAWYGVAMPSMAGHSESKAGEVWPGRVETSGVWKSMVTLSKAGEVRQS